MSTEIRPLSPELRTRYRGHLSLCEIDTAGQEALADASI